MISLKHKKILLIGGSGFIGLHLAKRLSKLERGITIYCKGPDKAKKLDFADKIKFTKGNIADYKAIEENIKDKDAIINLTAIVQDSGKFDPYIDLEVNCHGQINVLEARKKVNPSSKYIFIGTRSQFGKVNEKDLPISEEYCQKPISLYGIHKQTAENYCKLYKKTFNLKSVILRLPQVYGPSLTKEKTHSIIDKFIKKAMRDEVFYVNGFGQDVKDVIHIDDVVNLIIKILESEVEEGVFNVGSGKKIKLIEIAEKIVKLCKSGSFKAVPFPPSIEKFELGNFYFDISKVKTVFKWEPKINLDDGIKKTIEFYKKG